MAHFQVYLESAWHFMETDSVSDTRRMGRSFSFRLNSPFNFHHQLNAPLMEVIDTRHRGTEPLAASIYSSLLTGEDGARLVDVATPDPVWQWRISGRTGATWSISRLSQRAINLLCTSRHRELGYCVGYPPCLSLLHALARTMCIEVPCTWLWIEWKHEGHYLYF